MKDMIDEIITSKATNDDFLRRAVLILIGTVLAPTSTYTVYKPFYAFVETMYKLHNLNWNQFTLAYVMEQISTCRRGIYVRQWPKGNVAILEYLYWEKVQPLDEIALYARISSRPLMINWTEAAVALRDSYDQDNGRGKGILKIEDNITEEYRRQYGKKSDGNKNMGAEIKKPGTGRSNGKGNGRSTGKDVVKLLNKSGVRYKPFAETLSDQYCYDEGCGSYLNGVPERKEFVYDKKVSKEDNKEEDYITPARTKCDFLGDGTLDNPWELPEDFKEASSSEVPSNIFEPALKKMNKEDEQKEGASEGSKSVNTATGKNEDVNGKRKRKLPLKLQYPYIIENRTKRQPRKKPTPAIATPSSNDVEIPQDSTALTAEHIAAAEIFVQLCCKTEANGKKIIYKNDIGVRLTSQRLKVVLDHKWCTDDAYFPVNISNNQWTTVIMHTPKEEFQVLDSLFPLSVTIDTVRALRQQISADIQEYNKSTSGFFPDVISWNIKSYDMPQQKDGNSCGLFVLQCMEHWDGDKWNKEISQLSTVGNYCDWMI
nr:uncharacterized protein LOC127335112 [Lolium perenne]